MGDTDPASEESDPTSASECAGNCPRTSRSATNKARDMNCAQIADKMKELTDTEKVGRSGPKGLLQRFRDFKGDDATHPGNIIDQQASLESYMQAYRDKGCGDPPAKTQELAKRKLPVSAPSKDQNVAKAVGTAGAITGAGYLTYRAVRMLPSLLPPLWETIPANALIP